MPSSSPSSPVRVSCQQTLRRLGSVYQETAGTLGGWGRADEGAAATLIWEGQWKVNQRRELERGPSGALGRMICPICQASGGFRVKQQLCEVKCHESLSAGSPSMRPVSRALGMCECVRGLGGGWPLIAWQKWYP